MSMALARAHLARHGFEDRVIELPPGSSATVADAAAQLGCEPAHIAKTIALLSPEGPILVIAAGDVKIDNQAFKARFHAKAKMIPGADVEALVGHAPGGVCPFGVKPGVEVYLDESLKRFDIVYPACGNAASGVRLSPAELEEASEALGWVAVTKPAAPKPEA